MVEHTSARKLTQCLAATREFTAVSARSHDFGRGGLADTSDRELEELLVEYAFMVLV